jgi:hypothetical protein
MQILETVGRYIKAFLAPLTAMAFLTALSGCAEDPNPVGSRLLPSSDFLALDTTSTLAIASWSAKAIPSHSFTGRLLVGAHNAMEAWSVLRFADLPDSLKGIRYLSAHLFLRSNYHFGDSLGAFSLAAHQVLRLWGQDSLTIDSVRSAGFHHTTPMSITSFGSVHDTATIRVPLDTSVVKRWIETVTDTVTTNFGILLRPTNTSVIKGFASFGAASLEHRPALQIIYRREGTTRVDTARLNSGIFRSVATMPSRGWENDSTSVYVQNGISYRGFLQFDITKSLPARAAIHQATLEVYRNATASRRNSYTRDSLYAYYLDKDGKIIGSLYTQSVVRQKDGMHIYTFQLAPFVQLWARDFRPSSIALIGEEESNAFDLFVLHGATAPAGFKPKLTIIFSPM